MLPIRLIRHLLGAACLLSGLVQAADPVFHLGVAPHTSPRVILEMYKPLRQYLEKALGQTVLIETAPDFTEFGRRALNQEYDIAITTGHQAHIYQNDAAYLPLLTYKAEFKAIAIVAKNGPIRKATDLQGSTVLGLSPSSLVTQWGLHWLQRNKLNNITVKYVSAADSVSHQVLAGEASAGFTSLANYQKLPVEQQSALSILVESEAMAGRIYMLNKRQIARRAKIEQALFTFAETTEGKNYFDQAKLEGYRKLHPHELDAMEPFAATTRQLLKSK
jgi:phosphonate transport system substrate-binding protein